MEREIVNDVLDADKCLLEAEDSLTKKDYKRCHDLINEARELLQCIIKLDEDDSRDVELERSKAATHSMTLPYTEKF